MSTPGGLLVNLADFAALGPGVPSRGVATYSTVFLESHREMRLSTKARYGVRALVHIAHHGYASAQAIAERQAIPARYLEEIIGELRRAGLVVGKRGPRGGYRLGRPAA